jgi:5'-phosphate synthase pdxT subunit
MNSLITKVPPSPKVGLLATQGDYAMHRRMVESLGYECVEVRTTAQLQNVDCLIMPGGESTTMRKILKWDGLWDALAEFGTQRAIMGTCAGLILLSKKIIGGKPEEDTLGLIDIDSDRNAYGSQFHSFRAHGQITLSGGTSIHEMVFIRAPQITRVGEHVEILGHLVDQPTMVRQGHVLALSFHPEMTEDLSIHRYFIESMVKPVLAEANSKAA